MIVIEKSALDCAVADSQTTVQSGGQAENNPALELCYDSVLMGEYTAIGHAPDLRHAQATLRAFTQLHHLCDIALFPDWIAVQTPVPLGIWRSVGHSYTAFAIESFVDELADKAGADPIEYRLRLLPASSRLRNCLSRVAAMSRWAGHRDAGRALGVAVAHCFGSFIATVCEVTTEPGQPPRVASLWSAVDCGTVVHPDGVRAQIEGGAVFGLTAAL